MEDIAGEAEAAVEGEEDIMTVQEGEERPGEGDQVEEEETGDSKGTRNAMQDRR